MAGDCRLIKPGTDFKEAYLDFYREWKDSGERMVPWVIGKDPSDFEEMLRFLEENETGTALKEGWVRSSTYWLVEDSGKVLGVVNIRHGLTEALLRDGGHIGYGIRPSERWKGYAARLLGLALHKASLLGISDALVVCGENNLASERTILRNCGLADEPYIDGGGNVTKRFWIHTAALH